MDEFVKLNPAPVTTGLRVCKQCGLRAETFEDLELFVLTKNMKYGRRNLCKKCRIKENNSSLHGH